ncbi:hypothetical protein TL16_g04973 [Triparma laevis f. inornata]|uniref:Uncharacterized protein n=1 Tax=Triparma laevis f. inornata TaxID=1714386 RepID=A0A9W7A9R0_9STRA|nr:hypothetical protein TL16_g04973 [Triparma laevis f. inornata]
MSKSLASESKDGNKSREMSEKRGAEDEVNENEEGIIVCPSDESLTISTVVSTVPATTDQFMFTDDFKRLLVDLVQGDMLMTLRLATKAWKRVVDAFIDEGVRSGAMIVHSGKDVSFQDAYARRGRHALLTQVIFLLNITKVGEYEFFYAANLVVVEIPDGVESISESAFDGCESLTTVSFPKTLRSIGKSAFANCSSLENVDLLHTNLQELGSAAFWSCSELKSMTIPDSLRKFPSISYWYEEPFFECFKLVPSYIDVSEIYEDAASEVVAYLRFQQQLAKIERSKQVKEDARARRALQREKTSEKVDQEASAL